MNSLQLGSAGLGDLPVSPIHVIAGAMQRHPLNLAVIRLAFGPLHRRSTWWCGVGLASGRPTDCRSNHRYQARQHNNDRCLGIGGHLVVPFLPGSVTVQPQTMQMPCQTEEFVAASCSSHGATGKLLFSGSGTSRQISLATLASSPDRVAKTKRTSPIGGVRGGGPGSRWIPSRHRRLMLGLQARQQHPECSAATPRSSEAVNRE